MLKISIEGDESEVKELIRKMAGTEGEVRRYSDEADKEAARRAVDAIAAKKNKPKADMPVIGRFEVDFANLPTDMPNVVAPS
jgi:hypothetical protein